MLDRDTERALYLAFHQFFLRAERERRWNLWNEVPWDRANPEASDTLADAVLAAYAEELFLPDYAHQTLHLLRASRGRAWFVTRWSYEEGKHILALGEWLSRSGKQTGAQLKAFADRLLGETTRSLALLEPVAALVLGLAREREEIERYRRLHAQAAQEQDEALVAVCDQLVGDEEAHFAFFRDALRIIQEREPGLVADTARRIVALPQMESLAPLLRAELGVV